MKTLIYRLLFIAVVSLTLTQCTPDKEMTGSVLNGSIKNANGKLIFLEDVNGSAPIVIDTALVEGNKVQLNAETYKGIYRIRLADVASKNPALVFLSENSKVKFSFDANEINNYEASGNKETEAINAALVDQSSYFAKVEELRSGLTTIPNGSKKADSIQKVLQATYVQAGEAIKESIAEIQDLDPHAVALLLNLLSPQTERQFISDELKKCIEKDPNSKFIKAMAQRYGLVAGGQQQQQQRPPSGLAVGTKAPDIKQTNPNGEIMALSSLQGKYVLIDFWASWCKPCRIENPNVVRTYNKYKDKGFEIYSVSFDKQKERWIKAIKDDGLTWQYHVGDLKGWQNEAAGPYGVRSIPATFLIDPEGNIIAKNLRGPALENKLEEIFGAG